MKGSMTRAGAGTHLRERWLIRHKRSLSGVKAIKHQFVQPEVGHGRKPIIGRGLYPVGMWRFLPLLIRSGTLMLHKRGSLAQSAVLKHREDCDAAPTIICHQDMFPRLV